MPRKPPEGVKWKPGQSGNPLGGAAHNPVVKAVRRMTKEQVAEMLQVLLENDVERLEEIELSKTEPTLKVWIASIATHGIKRGDAWALNIMLDRIVGKPKETIEIVNDPLEGKTTEEKIKILEDAIKFLKTGIKNESRIT